MAKVRVYELARELGKDTKALEAVIREMGIPIKNYMSTLTQENAERVRAHLKGEPAPGEAKPVEKRIAKTVIRRRGARRRPAAEAAAEATSEAAPSPAKTATATGEARTPTSRGPVVRRRVAAEPAPPAQAPGQEAAPAAPAAAAETPKAPTPEAPAASERPAPPAESAAPEPVRATPTPRPDVEVGTRIELPKGTRRLPGGLAERMADAPPPPAPEATAEAPPSPPAPEPSSEETQVAASDTAQPPTAGTRAVRNEKGVIVGAAKTRSEPKILGFIPLETRRKPKQVIITEAEERQVRGRASQRKQREERVQSQGRRRKMMRPRRGAAAGPSRPSTVEMKEEKKRIRMEEAIRVADLAHQMGQKASKLLKVLWGMGMRGITINSSIDFPTAELVAAEFGYAVENVAFDESEIIGEAPIEDAGEPRAPVVTIMGHVDHGKTTLMDTIRRSRVAEGEAGGITQHIGAYRVETDKGPVVFLDTPGHEAFSAMRARGATLTDIVVLVVAADDGVMPTTVEAIKHAREANVPIIVAINKIDKPEANVGRVKQGLMEHGLVGEEFGGDTLICEVSAKTGQGVEELLETLALQSELLDLRAPKEGRAQGAVIEARIDKGRGPVATVLVQKGTLHKGDIVVAGECSGKVRRMFDDRGKPVKEAGPSVPVEILGLDGVPRAGDPVHAVATDRDARQLVQHRREQRKRKESVRSGPSIHELLQRKRTPVLKVVLKADVFGSAEALRHALQQLSTDRVKVEVLKAEVGAINETDVKFAKAGDAVVFGFNVKTAGKAANVAEQERVDIYTFQVIYDALDKAKELMVGMLEPEYREVELGEAEVRALFPIPRLGVVAGCRVTKGVVRRSSRIRVVRDGKVVHVGDVASLKHFKEDVREVKEGFECGIVVAGFDDVAVGDVLQAFELEEIPPEL
ncbi:MAG: translation initiation factor IF-2 [Deltaproteobacteria bacterium]|nr:MAG: translation initiation factor IF-2 [Deltaproteobacteria bacterium]